MIKKLLFILSLIPFLVFSQEQKPFYGTVIDDLNPLENAHIINITNKIATNSNPLGKFKIFAKINDSIKITSVGYTTKIIVLKASDFGLREKQIHLKKEIIELDEIEIKNHQLTGSLEVDSKQTPKDKMAELSANIANDIKNMDSEAIKNMPYEKDEIHLVKVSAPGIPNSFSGIGTSISSLDPYGIEIRALRKEIAFKEIFPKQLLSDFGHYFFFAELKIPIEKYYHFLEFCNPLGIEKLYKSKKTLTLIKVLTTQSKLYLKSIKENK